MNAPVCVGVPLTAPALDSVIPAGSAPLVTANVDALLPPVCVRVVAGYTVPAFPAANVVTLNAIAGHAPANARKPPTME